MLRAVWRSSGPGASVRGEEGLDCSDAAVAAAHSDRYKRSCPDPGINPGAAPPCRPGWRRVAPRRTGSWTSSKFLETGGGCRASGRNYAYGRQDLRPGVVRCSRTVGEARTGLRKAPVPARPRRSRRREAHGGACSAGRQPADSPRTDAGCCGQHGAAAKVVRALPGDGSGRRGRRTFKLGRLAAERGVRAEQVGARRVTRPTPSHEPRCHGGVPVAPVALHYEAGAASTRRWRCTSRR